jgi:sorbitol/mannitol transport system substrate-binding protein
LPIPEAYDLDDILPSVRDQLTTRGVMYGLPFYAESSATFYRTDLFRNAGLTMPEHPTYVEIERFAKLLHRPDKGVYGICLRGQPGWGANMSFVTTLVHTSGGRWFDLLWDAQIDSTPWRRALDIYQRLGRFAQPTAEHNNYVENLALFAHGHCAMWVDATVAAGQLFDPKSSDVAASTGYTQAPVAITERGSRWLWVWALGISASSKSQDEARKFALWATSKEYVALVAERKGWLSVPPGTRKSTYDALAYRAAAPFAGFVRSAIEKAHPAQNTLEPAPYEGHYVGILEYPALGDLVGAEVKQLLHPQHSVQQVLTRAQKLVSDQMRESGYVER